MLAQYFQEMCAFPPLLKSKTLHFDHLEWSWILNYDAHNCIDFHDGISVLRAKNAAGKTNFLEVICIALFGEGFPSRYNKHYSAEIICDKKPAGTMANTLLRFTLQPAKAASAEQSPIARHPEEQSPIARHTAEQSPIARHPLRCTSYEQSPIAEVWTLKRVLKSNNDKRAVNFHEVSLTGANEVIQGQVAVSAWIEEHIGSVTEFLATAMHADGDFFSLDKGRQRALLEAPLEETRAFLQEVLTKHADTKCAECANTKCTKSEDKAAELAALIARRELLEKRSCTSCTPCTPCTSLEAGQDANPLKLQELAQAISECDTRLTALHSFSDLAEGDLKAVESDSATGTATGSKSESKSATGTLEDTTVQAAVSTHPLYNRMNIYEDMDVIRSMKGDSHSIDECLMKCAAYEWTDDRFIGFYPDAEERLLTNKKLLTRLKQATKERTAAKKAAKARQKAVSGDTRKAAFGGDTLEERQKAAFGGDTREDLLEQIREKEAYLQETAYPYNDQCEACANHPWRLRANAYQAELPSLRESLKALVAQQEAEAVRDAAAADVLRLDAEIAGLKAAKQRVAELERQLALREEFAAYRAERELRRVAAMEAEEQLKRSWYSALYSYRMAIAVQYRSLKEERAQLVAEKERIEAAIALDEIQRIQRIQRERVEEEERIAEAERLDKEIWRLQCAVKGVSEQGEMASVMLGLLDGYRPMGRLCSQVNELLREFGVTLEWADGWFIDSRVVEKASGFQRFVVGVAIRAALNVRYDQLFIDGLDICDAERFALMPALISGLRASFRSIYVVTHQDFIGERIPLGGSEGLAHIQHPADATVSISVPSKKGRPPKVKSAEVTVTKE